MWSLHMRVKFSRIKNFLKNEKGKIKQAVSPTAHDGCATNLPFSLKFLLFSVKDSSFFV